MYFRRYGRLKFGSNSSSQQKGNYLHSGKCPQIECPRENKRGEKRKKNNETIFQILVHFKNINSLVPVPLPQRASFENRFNIAGHVIPFTWEPNDVIISVDSY